MKAQLKIHFANYWHAGGGRDAGSVLDAIVHRDVHGLPVVPGRHIKGLLRDALERAETWEWEGYSGLAATLFGDRSETASNAAPQAGCLRVSDGMLPSDVAKWLGSEAGARLRPGLHRALYATAVEHDSGVAKDHSLRGIEVTVPLDLTAVVEEIPGRNAPENWLARLGEVLPLIDALGAYRSRGLGRVQLQLEAHS